MVGTSSCKAARIRSASFDCTVQSVRQRAESGIVSRMRRVEDTRSYEPEEMHRYETWPNRGVSQEWRRGVICMSTIGWHRRR